MNRRIRRILLLAIGLGLVIYIVSYFTRAVYELSKNPIKFQIELPPDYKRIFNSVVQNSLNVQSGASFKLRSAIIVLSYKNEYNLEITKLFTKPSLDIK